MAASPASASNLDWLLHKVLASEAVSLASLNDDVAAILSEHSELLYYPFLYGSPYGAEASAAIIGLRGWHGRVHIARAIFEGVVFSHLEQLNGLRDTFGEHPIRLTGGGARSAVWGQLFADAARTVIEVPEIAETGCWGAALCAAAGINPEESVESLARRTSRIRARYTPAQPGVDRMAGTFDRYQQVREKFTDIWPLLSHRQD